jgi:Fur family ferric uptake transcriptional regulator
VNAQTKNKAWELLKDAGMRRTQCRVSILSALLKAGKPLTREEIADALSQKAPNKVTIYRTLQSLLSANLIHKAFVQDRTWHFEPAHNCTADQCHPHFTCTSCNRTHCLTKMSLPMAKSPHNGFIIQHQKVQLEGLCPKCNTENTL